jgi:uncharacterized membrane protein YqaE (UPF0057 family)
MHSWQQASAVRPLPPWAVVAAILLPPLGVFMMRGLSPAFWLTVAATLVGWVPGIVLALLLILFPERIPIR